MPNPRDYKEVSTSWKADISAGLTVGIVALPLALAFGVSSGVGAEAGLITAIVAGLVAAIFGGSPVQVSGPTGAMVVVLAPIVATHGSGALAVVSLMAGAFVLLAGIFNLGRLVAMIPWPVIEGFTVGIGITIFWQQVPAAVGGSLAKPQLTTLAVTLTTVILMLVLAKFTPRLPSSFIAIILVTLGSMWLKLPLETIGKLPDSLPTPAIPTLNIALVQALLGPALAVAALAAIESLLSARVAASISTTGPVNADRELVGQGLASIAAGFFGGMPATGAIARTAVNVRAGARTRVAGIVHAIFLVGVVYLASTLVSTIPLAALAGVLMVTAARMISPQIFRQVLEASKSSVAVFLLTATVTVTVDLVWAVGVGIIAAGAVALRRLSQLAQVRREPLPGSAQPGDDRIGLFQIEGALFFGAAEKLGAMIAAYENIDVAIIRLSQVQLIDTTGAFTLTQLVEQLERRGVTVLIKGVRPEHIHLLGVSGALKQLRRPEHLFADLSQAVDYARSLLKSA
ncbi:Bicarbonate transporter BicA [Corynebacterium caspium DSM 44850]|nr:Bicarbonate transporter BicA [Corynebacterium caspium DSM 44850]